MLRTRLLALALSTLIASVSLASSTGEEGSTGQPGSPGLRNNVVFTEYSPLSTGAELVRRLFSPLNALRINEQAAKTGKPLGGQTIDLSSERFSVYVPVRASPPSRGYSLLVFVSPWPRAEVPLHWIASLDRHETILVTAANSGNDANVIDRREPLPLLEVQNVIKQYRVDPQQVYIGGFSGGSRVALRLALGFPDVFHGALLNAGSDPIGTVEIPLPPAELFKAFQESTRLVYVTGERDDDRIVNDMRSRQSMQKWCVFDVVTVSEPWKAHEVADASAFDRALEALIKRGPTNPSKLADCRARISHEMSTQLKQAEDLLGRGERDAGRKLLDKIDAQYSGLAAPVTSELFER
jgi:pimeloyl-ACP methyl ester carboxylesterase